MQSLPYEILGEILCRVSPLDAFHCRGVCNAMERASRNPVIWKLIAEKIAASGANSPEENVKQKLLSNAKDKTFWIKDRLFRIALAQEGKIRGKRGICVIAAPQPLTPFPPPLLAPERQYMGPPAEHALVFSMSKLDQFAMKAAMRALHEKPALQPADKSEFLKCLKKTPPNLFQRIITTISRFIKV